MEKVCGICQKKFEIKSKYGHQRKYCYECSPEGVSRGERTTIKRQSAKKQALILLGGKCLKCGISEPYLIDFHHLVSEEKEGAFSTLLGASKIKEYFEELEKAIPLCSNCHRTFHFLERTENITIQDFLAQK